jgi:hypothetical protein
MRASGGPCFANPPPVGSYYEIEPLKPSVAMEEGHLPEELIIGTDNTPKETKNKFFCWFCMWILCVFSKTSLWGILLVCLLVGHTHDDIDRLFSRIKVALAGHDYFTVIEMLNLMVNGLPGFELHTSHLSRIWAWKDMETLGSSLPLLNQFPRAAHIPRNMTPAIRDRFLT